MKRLIQNFSIFLLLFNTKCFSKQLLRIDCHPERNASQETCQKRQCLWIPSTEPRVPSCIFKPWNQGRTEETFYGYNLKRFQWNETAQKLVGQLTRRETPSLFGNDYKKLTIKIEALSDTVYHVLFRDEQKKSGRIRLKPNLNSRFQYSNTVQLEILFEQTPFGFALKRKSTGRVIFDIRYLPGLSMAEQYTQISVRVPSQYVYGLGETSYTQLKHDFNWRQWGFFAQDQRPHESESNLYGVHPFYMCLEDIASGYSHGVFFANAHAMNVALQPDPDIVTFRAIGGSTEFYIFAGPTPDLVLEQYTSIIGRPNMPPYWALGYHLSRYGYKNLTYLREVFDRNRALGIPQDVQFVDLDYANGRLDFTVDPKNYANFSTFIDELHSRHMKLVVIVDPAISSKPTISPYDPLTFGLKWDVFIKDNRTGRPLEGRVWPGSTYFADFTKEATTNYWKKMLHDFRGLVNYDGIWIDMNEPSNFVNGSLTFCANNSLNYPPYNPLIYDPIFDNTICMDSDQAAGKHYSYHNLYGYTEAEATYRALRSLKFKRPFVLSRSTFSGSGQYTNHWTGDNHSKWSHMRYSIISVLLFQLFGIPMTGADICGFEGEATEELCLRWTQLGAFYPYSRNHNSDEVHQDQDPGAWSYQTAKAMQDVLLFRYSLLPYLYTLFYKAHSQGRPVWRPLFFDFLNDPITRTIDDQFLLGHGLMVAPILEPNSTSRFAYFPEGVWYLYHYRHEDRNLLYSKGNFSLDLGQDIGSFVRGGSVIPCQFPEDTTDMSRLNPYFLLVALDSDGRSSGDLYVDDGECIVGKLKCPFAYLKFSTWSEKVDEDGLETGYLNITRVNKSGYTVKQQIFMMYIFGIKRHINEVKIDGVPLNPIWIFTNDDCLRQTERYCWLRLMVVADMNLNNDHVITWK